MAGYVFLANSTKPTAEKARSREAVKLSTVNRPCVRAALDMGYDVYLGVNRENPEELECELPIKLYDSHTYRSLTAFRDNYTAYKNLCRVMEQGNVRVIHCNTPIGGLVGRLCGRKYKADKVIYTAHGFHFYKGAPKKNWLLYYPVERFLAHWTDAIITMNREDYEAAKKFKLRRGGKVYFVHGVGIDLQAFSKSPFVRQEKRAELGLSEKDIVIISAGDLNQNKNQCVILSAMQRLGNKNIQYFLCGIGEEEASLREQAKAFGLSSQIHFLGFRNDVKDLLQAADIFVLPSFREGMPRSMMEAMANGLPCVASSIRGNVDLIENGKGGYLCAPTDADGFAAALSTLAGDAALREEMRAYNLEKIKEYDVSVVEREIRDIYNEVLGG